MAEFCLECWKEIGGTEATENQYIVSEELELCEGCGEWKHVIVSERSFFDGLIFHPIKLIKKLFCIFNQIVSKDGD